MAKKKYDKTKYQPTIADITTLGEALAEYAKECEEAKRLMTEKDVASLLVSNWDTVIWTA